ncbi:MAG: PepSY-like domain-containing protein [Bacteroidetes bacterium]|nr:PepSY-like domain-containing protein [Bacteroidota bacterium]
MKKSIFITIAALGALVVNAQKLKEAEVPAKVKESFANKYKGSKAEKWEKEGANYETETTINKIETSILFNANGDVIETEQALKTSALPKNITDYCAKNFAGYKISEAAKITTTKGAVTFEAEMKKGKEHFDALFDDKGNFLSKSDVKIENEKVEKE